MANTMIGKLHVIGDVVSIPTKTGKDFVKREITLDCTTYDRYTGQPNSNYPSFELVGERTKLVDNFKKDDMVEVSFFLSGRQYEKDGETKYITSIVAYDIKAFNYQPQSQNAPHEPQNEPQAQPTQQPPQAQKEETDNLPF